MCDIDVVMATYNGAKYLSKQLDSIISSNNFEEIINLIIISDDKSTDGTVELLKQYSSKYEFIKIYQNEAINGVVGNFENALKYSNADYIVLSDQDDFWLPEKIKYLA